MARAGENVEGAEQGGPCDESLGQWLRRPVAPTQPVAMLLEILGRGINQAAVCTMNATCEVRYHPSSVWRTHPLLDCKMP